MLTQSLRSILTTSLSLMMLAACSSATDRNTQQAFEVVSVGDWDMAITLVGNGTVLNAIDDKGYTLLHLSENPALTALLIEKGHDVNLQSGGMFSKKEKEDFITGRKVIQAVSEKMKNSMPEIDENDPYFGENLSPLHTVKNSDTIKILLDAGANPNVVSQYDATPVAEVRELGSLRHIIDAGATMQPSNYGRSPLHEFFENNDIKSFQGGREAYFAAIKLFVDAGVNLKIKDNGDSNVLHAANYKATPEMLTYLLKSGADPKMEDGNWGGAFCLAIKESQDELVLAYAVHDFTLLYHKCDGDRFASIYANEEAKFETTHQKLIKMEELAKQQLQKQ